MIFLIYRHLIDVTFCLHFVILQPPAIIYWQTDPILCSVTGAIAVSLSSVRILSEPILALNRYVSVCHRNIYQKIYKKRNIYLMYFGAFLIEMCSTAGSLASGSLGRFSDLYCSVILKKENIISQLAFGYLFLTFSYNIVFYCYCKVFRVLRNHQDHSSNGQASHLQGDKSLLRYIGIVALLPIVTETPVFAMATISMFNPTLVPDFVLAIGMVIFLFLPLINPILTVYMVRPIRKEFLGLTRKIFRKNQVTPEKLDMTFQQTAGQAQRRGYSVAGMGNPSVVDINGFGHGNRYGYGYSGVPSQPLSIVYQIE